MAAGDPPEARSNRPPPSVENRMTEDASGMLRELQELDLAMARMQKRFDEFEPLLQEIEEPIAALEEEVATLRARVQEMRLEERRLEHAADDRRTRSKKLQERLKSVRNLREEAAVQAELDLVRRALEGEEQEALSLLDQIRKMEARLEEQDSALEEARGELEPRRAQLLAERKKIQDDLSIAKDKRDNFASRVPSKDLQHYERIKGGGRPVAVASLTPDGACGHCFSMVPLQIQNEIRKGKTLIPCEACGVLLGPGEEDS